MSWLDMVPGVSQVKALAQALTGDKEGAERTMERFATKTPILSHVVAGVAKVCGDDAVAKQCWDGGNSSLNALPVVGHAKGLGHYALGDIKGGHRAMKRATDTSLGMMDSVPVVGHAKGVIHYLMNNEDAGDRAMLTATRTAAVMVGGAGGFLLAGPGGAIAGGMATGTEWDIGTAIATDGKKADGICKIIEKPTKVDSYFDAGLSLAGDAMTGYSGGKLAERAIRTQEIRTAENLKSTRQSKNFPKDRSIAPEGSKEVYCEVTDTKTGKTYTGINESVRKDYGDLRPQPNKFLQQNSEITVPTRRHPSSCAEPQALHKYLADQPNSNGSTMNTRMTTLEVRPNGEIYNIPRCQNCVAYKDVVGKCTTDMMPRRVPGANEYLTRGGAAFGTAAAVTTRAGRATRSTTHQH